MVQCSGSGVRSSGCRAVALSRCRDVTLRTWLSAIAVQLKVGEGANDRVARRTGRIFGPPGEDVRPHANDGLGQDVWIEAIPRASVRDGFAASGADPTREAFENSRAHVGGFAAGMKNDSDQVALLFSEPDQGFRLGSNNFDRIGLAVRDLQQAGFEFPRCVLREFAKKRLFVLEVEIERPGGITGVRGDCVTRDRVRSALGEKRSTGLEKSGARLLGPRHSQIPACCRVTG